MWAGWTGGSHSDIEIRERPKAARNQSVGMSNDNPSRLMTTVFTLSRYHNDIIDFYS